MNAIELRRSLWSVPFIKYYYVYHIKQTENGRTSYIAQLDRWDIRNEFDSANLRGRNYSQNLGCETSVYLQNNFNWLLTTVLQPSEA